MKTKRVLSKKDRKNSLKAVDKLPTRLDIAMEAARRYGFKNYKGGAGPTERQCAKNAMALFSGLIAIELPSKIEWKATEKGSEDQDLFVTVGRRTVVYDRWGFCSTDGRKEFLDQATLEDAFRYLFGEVKLKVVKRFPKSQRGTHSKFDTVTT